MKYEIFKLNENLGKLRWWRNYEIANKNYPDIDIETYLENHNFTWTPFLNTSNQPIKYESLNRTNINEIELYIDDVNNIPDYIKIEFTKNDNTKESAYYYVDNGLNIYNATTKLSVKVKYVLDKYASYYYMFHKYFIDNETNVFFVRKHTDRFIGDYPHYYFNFSIQPYLLRNNPNIKDELIVKMGLTINYLDLSKSVFNTYDQSHHIVIKDINVPVAGDVWELPCFTWAGGTISTSSNFEIKNCTTNVASGIVPHTQTINYLTDNMFTTDENKGLQEKPYFEYIIVKPFGFMGGGENRNLSKIKVTDVMIIPIRNTNIPFSDDKTFGYYNVSDNFYLFESMFSSDNIITRITSPISPLTLLALFSRRNVIYSSALDSPFKDNIICVRKEGGTERIDGFLVGAAPEKIKLDYFHQGDMVKNINDLIKRINNYTYGAPTKTPENNPHIYAPQYYHTIYCSTPNNKSVLTADYIDTWHDNTDVFIDISITSEWTTRLLVDNWNPTGKLLSQTGNELACDDTKQAPILSSGWVNAYQQRHMLDIGKNNLISSNALSLGIGTLGTTASFGLLASGVGAPAGAIGLLASLGSLFKTGLSMHNGLAQYEQQMKNIAAIPSTMNALINNIGMSYKNTWCENYGLHIDDITLSSQATIILNNDDNMYGYYVESWASYDTYLNCWDGNYMLIDVNKNYNTLFKALKEINSIFTIDDTYINDFLTTLNNGVTWFNNGEYVDLATDQYNWERIWPKHTTKKKK